MEMANYKDPIAWFNDDIWPDYQDFLADPIERKARHVAISLNGFLERVYKVYSKTNPAKLKGAKSPHDLLSQLASKCPALKLVKDVANPSKHHLPDSRTSSKAPLTTATDAIHTDSHGMVRIGGSINLDFEPVVTAAVMFWKGWL